MESLFEELATYKGFRLEWFEFLNWGVFNKTINRLNLNMQNSLLSGEIGSGKSTIVDAICTLLLPTNKIIYNKAAGAKAKERTLQSYILGEYKKSIDEYGVASVKRLRDESDFTLLIAKFKNEGLMEEVYLGLFLSARNAQVVKIYFISREKIEIKDFVNIKNIKEFKKAIKQKATVYESYKDYFNAYKKILGIKDLQAMQLFYQMVSMKSVENLNSFIREHMLEKRDIDTIIDEMIVSFKELKQAHDLIIDAKKQIEMLSEVEKAYNNYKNTLNELEKTKEYLEKIEGVFAKHELIRKEEFLKKKEITLKTYKKKLQEVKEKKDALQQYLIDLKVDFEKSGGGRIERIKEQLSMLQNELIKRDEKLKRYKDLLKKAGFAFSRDYRNFLNLKENITKELENIKKSRQKIITLSDSVKYAIKKYEEELNELESEIIYLKTHKNQYSEIFIGN